jgi:ornithine cyclodeaminase/alanine dehydrogenase-like protein (mu-crystallin family)
MTKIFTLDEIKQVINPEEAIQAIEEGFLLYAKNLVVVAPLASLEIENNGIAKIKYGYIKGKDTYVMKVGSFFPGNTEINLPSINASMQIYSQHTGAFEALLLDEAYLTNVRTAAASVIVVKYFAPEKITKIGIIGTGIQAKFQLNYLKHITACKKVMIWGKNIASAEQFKLDMEKQGFIVEIAKDISDIISQCNLIITATSAVKPIIFADPVQSGTLIISVGADTKNKCELHEDLLKKADLILADSRIQCCELGNIAHALQTRAITEDSIVELGDAMIKNIRRKDEQQIIVANLTGVAVQDIQIANLAYQALLKKKRN